MPSKKAEIQNIYALLNDFNRAFGEKPKYSISFVSPERSAIYIKMLYDEHVNIPPSKESNTMRWNTIINSRQNYAMAKLSVSEDSGKVRFFQYFDNIYINDYVMPDEEKANRFYKAKEEFTDNTLMPRYSGEFVTVGNALLQKSIKDAEELLKKAKENVEDSYGIEEIKRNAKKLVKTCEFLELLQKAAVQRKEF